MARAAIGRPTWTTRPWPRPGALSFADATLVGLLVLVLTIFPVARVEFGRVPVYISDLLISLALLALLWRGRFEYGRFGLVVLLYLAAWLPAWLLQVSTLGIFLEPTYGLIRNVLAVCCFFIGFAAAGSRDLARLGTVFVVGTLVTSMLAIAQQLPPTDELTQQLLVALAPAFTPAAYTSFTGRSFALFTGATTLSGFLAVALTLLVGGGCWGGVRGRRVALGAAVLAGVAAVATVSRQWLPALAAGFLALALLQRAVVPRMLAWGGLTVATTLLLVLVNGLDGAFLAARFGRLAQGSQEPNVALRLERQVTFLGQIRAGLIGVDRAGMPAPTSAPASVVVAPGTTPTTATPAATSTGALATAVPAAPAPAAARNLAPTASRVAAPATAASPSPAVAQATTATPSPVSIGDAASGASRVERLGQWVLWQRLLGLGFANQDLIDRGVVDAATADYLRAGFNDNVFLLEVRNHGIMAGLTYLVLLALALARGVAASRRPGPTRALATTLTAGLVTAVALHPLDNYFSESVFMKSGLWLLIGALVGLTATRPKRSAPARTAAATSPV